MGKWVEHAIYRKGIVVNYGECMLGLIHIHAYGALQGFSTGVGVTFGVECS